MRRSEVIIFAITLSSFISGIYFYPHMPEQVAAHWNAQGQVESQI